MKRLFIICLVMFSIIVSAQTMTDRPKETTLPSDSLVFIVEWYNAGSGETGYMLLDDLIGLIAGDGLIKSGGIFAVNPGASSGLSIYSDALKINLSSGSGLTVDGNTLEVFPDETKGLAIWDSKLSIKTDSDSGMAFTDEGYLKVVLMTAGGLAYTINGLKINIASNGGLTMDGNILKVELISAGGLEVSASGIQINPEEAIRANSVWVTSASQNPYLFALPENAKVLSVDCWVSEEFNSDGTDQITVGYDALTDAYATAIDVSTTGVKTVTLGAVAKTAGPAYSAAECYYVNGGSEPTAGKASITITWTLITASP